MFFSCPVKLFLWQQNKMNFLMIWIEANAAMPRKKTSRGEKLFFYPIFLRQKIFYWKQIFNSIKKIKN